jgi:hypothetical protein
MSPQTQSRRTLAARLISHYNVMNYFTELLDAVITLGKILLFILTYYFSKFAVLRSRKDTETNPTLIEEVGFHVAALSMIVFAAFAISDFEKFNLSFCIVFSLPAIFGIRHQFREEASLTPKERVKRSIKIWKQDRENRKYDDIL